MPKGTAWGAIGNDASCDLHALFTVLAGNTSALYTLSLNAYFLLVIRYNMTEAKIKKYAEPYLHVLPTIYTLTTTIAFYALDFFNPPLFGTICGIAGKNVEKEVNCDETSDINDCFKNLNLHQRKVLDFMIAI